MSLARRLLGLLCSIVLGIATYWSVRLAWADHLVRTESPSEEAIARAIALDPENAELYGRLGEYDPKALLTAVKLCPMNSLPWILLGLRADAHQDLTSAERFFTEAARVDHTFWPRWDLAGFYYRHNELEKFWYWMRQALEISYDDPSPLFEMCWKMSTDAHEILSRGIPNRPVVVIQYLSFLMEKHFEAAGPVAAMVLERGSKDGSKNGVPVLLTYCDRLIRAQESTAAVQIWNGLCERKLIPYTALKPEQGISLTNGNFAVRPLGQGFDWVLSSLTGVLIDPRPSLATLSVKFSGKQPEACEILSQFFPVLPSRRYRLRFQYHTSGIASQTGLRWVLFDPASKQVMQQSADLSSDRNEDQTVVFSTPKEGQLARLALTYQRTLGTMRIEGSISVRYITLGLDE